MAAQDITLKFVFLGHVDHGKSTLAGRMLVDTGVVTERDIEKAKQEAEFNKMPSWYLAYLLDEDVTERLSGKTHQYMTKDLMIEDKWYQMIDVPGHQKLVTEMVEGVSLADIGILVCSARKGELEQGLRGQTFEHSLLGRGLGLSKLIIAVNKMDELDWSLEEFNRIKTVISDKLKSLKFVSLSFVPISAYHGENISTRKYEDQPCLLETITSTTVNRNRVGNTIIKVKDKFKATMIFMKLESILISRGFECILHSGKVTCTVTINRMEKYKFITPKQEGEPIKVEFLVSTPDIELKSFFVLRLGDITVGVGRII